MHSVIRPSDLPEYHLDWLIPDEDEDPQMGMSQEDPRGTLRRLSALELHRAGSDGNVRLWTMCVEALA